MPAICSIAALLEVRASRPAKYGADAGGRARTAPRPHHQRGALRAAAKQAGNRRDRRLRPFSRGRAGGMPRLRAILALGAIAHNAVLAAKGLKRRALQIRARRDARTAGRHGIGRQLSLLAAEHEYRHADPADVRGGDRRPRPSGWVRSRRPIGRLNTKSLRSRPIPPPALPVIPASRPGRGGFGTGFCGRPAGVLGGW